MEPKAMRWIGVRFTSSETDNWEMTGTPRILQDAERCGVIPLLTTEPEQVPGEVSMCQPKGFCLWMSLGTEPRVSYMLNKHLVIELHFQPF